MQSDPSDGTCISLQNSYDREEVYSDVDFTSPDRRSILNSPLRDSDSPLHDWLPEDIPLPSYFSKYERQSYSDGEDATIGQPRQAKCHEHERYVRHDQKVSRADALTIDLLRRSLDSKRSR